MKIRYTRKYTNSHLIFGLIWLFLFFTVFFLEDKLRWMDYGYLVISVMYLICYVYQQKNGYLTLEKGIIQIMTPFGRKLNLDKIQQVKKFAGDYIVKTDKKQMTINTQIIAPQSLRDLDSQLEKLNIKWC